MPPVLFPMSFCTSLELRISFVCEEFLSNHSKWHLHIRYGSYFFLLCSLNFLCFHNKQVLLFNWKKTDHPYKGLFKNCGLHCGTCAWQPGPALSMCPRRKCFSPLGLCQPAPPPLPLKSSSCVPFKCIPGSWAAISHLPAIVTMRCFISLALSLLALEVALAQHPLEQVINSGRPQLFITLLLEEAWRVPQIHPSNLCPE